MLCVYFPVFGCFHRNTNVVCGYGAHSRTHLVLYADEVWVPRKGLLTSTGRSPSRELIPVPSEERIHAGTGFHQLNQALTLYFSMIEIHQSPGVHDRDIKWTKVSNLGTNSYSPVGGSCNTGLVTSHNFCFTCSLTRSNARIELVYQTQALPPDVAVPTCVQGMNGCLERGQQHQKFIGGR